MTHRGLHAIMQTALRVKMKMKMLIVALHYASRLARDNADGIDGGDEDADGDEDVVGCSPVRIVACTR